MDGSNPEHYTIADFVNWYESKVLILNPDFQRGSVWHSQARTYLIDSILRHYPIPKLLMRTRIDRTSRKTIRDVVDGQQRLRTIMDFVNNKLVLGSKAGEFRGMRFRDLDDEQQDSFLAYKLTTEQLINASDEDVLEVFVRINSYTVPVNDAELRNAKYDNDFSDLVKRLVSELPELWELGVIPARSRVRMLDQSMIAEIIGFFINGIGEGGEANITKLYQQMDTKNAEIPDCDTVKGQILEVVELLEPLEGQRIVQRPHFVVLVAALGYLKGLIDPGKVDVAEMPRAALLEMESIRENIAALNDALSGDITSADYDDFVDASRSSTQRIKSREVRFKYMYSALTGE